MKRHLYWIVAGLWPFSAQAGIENWSAKETASAVSSGIPEIVWWLLAIFAFVAAVTWLARRWGWLFERLNEPSTFTATAVMLACGGLFAGSLSLDPVPLGQALLLAGAVFAFFGLIGKDDKGPLL